MFKKIILKILFIIILLYSINTLAQIGDRRISYCDTYLPHNYDPIRLCDKYESKRFLHLLYRGLLGFDEVGRLKCELAESFDFSMDSVTVHMRDGLLWSNGSKIRARDVVFSYDVYMNEENEFHDKGIFNFVSDAQRIDSLTVKFSLNIPEMDTTYLHFLIYPILPYSELGGYTTIQRNSQFSRHPVGCGPFVFSGILRRNTISLENNENYYKNRPDNYFNEVTMTFLNNIFTIASRFGTTDNILIDVPPTYQAELSNREGINLIDWDSRMWSGVCFNFEHEWLNIREVREAIVYSYNRPQAFESYFNGNGDLLSGPFTPGMQGADPNIMPREFNPERVRELMEGAGFTMSDGFWQRDGRTLDIRVTYNREDYSIGSLMVDFCTQLERAGFSIIRDAQPANNYETQVFNEHNFDLAYVTWSYGLFGGVSSLFKRSEIIRGRNNIGNFNDDQVEDILFRIQNVNNASARLDYKRELHRLLFEKLPYMFLWSHNITTAYIGDDIGNFDIKPDYFFYYIDTWYQK